MIIWLRVHLCGSSHLEFSLNFPFVYTAWLLIPMLEAKHQSSQKYLRQTISGRGVDLGPHRQYTHLSVIQMKLIISNELESFFTWKFLWDLHSVASGGCYYAERCNVVTLTTFSSFLVYLIYPEIYCCLKIFLTAFIFGVFSWLLFQILVERML